MARKTKVQQAAEAAAKAAIAASAGDQVLEIDDDDADPEESDILRALRELDAGNEVKWNVRKLDGTREERGFIEEISTSELDMQRFRDEYGPGIYYVKGLRNGQYFKGGHRKVVISSIGYKRHAGAPAPATADAATTVLAALDKRAESSRAELKSWAAIIGPLAAPIIAKLAERMFAGGDRVTDMVAALGNLKKLTDAPAPAPANQGMLETVDQVVALLDKISTLKPEAPSAGSTWIDLVRDGIKELPGLLGGIAGMRGMPALAPPPLMAPPAAIAAPPPPPGVVRQNPAPGAAQPTAPAPGTTADTSTANGGTPVNLLQLASWLRACVVDLVPRAAQARDPDAYATVVFDGIPPGTDLAQIRAFIERPDWWDQLQKFAPEAKPYPAWFEDFRTALLEEISEAMARQAPPSPGGGGTDPAPVPPGEGEEGFH